MIINRRGLDLIKSFEGLQLNAYVCPAGKLTIGYGHTSTVKPYQKITIGEAEHLLRLDCVIFEAAINKLVKVPLNENQYAALVSFTYNVGISAFKSSTLLRKLNKKDYNGAALEFPRWKMAAGRTLPGLVRRREAEKLLFLTKP
jgi:lysozyme